MRLLVTLTMSLLISSSAFANEQTSDATNLEGEQEATELAFAILSQEIGADEKDIELIHLSRINWPDSSLGCPKPGMMYTQAIVPGYMALLKSGVNQYRVHLGNGRGLVCNLKQLPLKLDEVILDNLKKMATQDLADKLGAEISNITVVEDQSMVWPDTNFGCSTSSEPSTSKSIRGYLIKLEYQGRGFEYRTSRSEVEPCPAIELD